MNGRMKAIRRRAMVLALAVIAVVALGGTALAGHIASDVTSYTGCLVPKDGVIIKVKEGNAPASPCTADMTQVHLSGGDITKISVTGALTGGGDNGEVTIGLKPEFTLPSGCTSGQVAKWNGSAWACSADNDTTYSAGTGLDLSAPPANAFSIEPAFRIPGKTCSTSGQFARGFDSNGVIQCQAPASTGLEVWRKVRPAIGAGTVILLPEGEGVDLIEMPLPAGTFLVTAVAEVSDEASGDGELNIGCFLRDAAFNLLPVHPVGADIGEESVRATATVTIHDVVSLASADTVRFTCRSGVGDGVAGSATMTAVKVGTVHTP